MKTLKIVEINNNALNIVIEPKSCWIIKLTLHRQIERINSDATSITSISSGAEDL